MSDASHDELCDVIQFAVDQIIDSPRAYALAPLIVEALRANPDVVLKALGFEKQPRICLDLYDEAWVPVAKEVD